MGACMHASANPFCLDCDYNRYVEHEAENARDRSLLDDIQSWDQNPSSRYYKSLKKRWNSWHDSTVKRDCETIEEELRNSNEWLACMQH